MEMDANSNCYNDPLATGGSLSSATAYSTISDDGTNTDPCGYFITLSYTGTYTNGVFTVLSNYTKALTIGTVTIAIAAFSNLFL